VHDRCLDFFFFAWYAQIERYMTRPFQEELFMQYTLTTLAERPELEPQLSLLDKEVWPTFMLKDAVAAHYWERLLQYFPQYQLILYDEQDQVVAEGNSIPLLWNGTVQDLPAGWDAVLKQGVSEYEQGQHPNALSALALLVKPTLRNQAMSSRMIQAMRTSATTHGLLTLLAPVRPSFKSRYPLISIEDYASWMREDRLPFDPWMRVHARLGAKIVKVAPQSMVITGTVHEWEEWTGMRLPQSGSYIIPEALVPLIVLCECNEGRYEEPNVWMQHSVPSSKGGSVPLW